MPTKQTEFTADGRTIYYQTKAFNDDGSLSGLSMRFPALEVNELVENGGEIAAKVAAILQKHWKDD